MLKPYDLLEGVLNEIEKGLKEDINENTLADNFLISSVHLRRLFKFAFGRTLGAYIRSRRLAASIEGLLLTDMNLLDIALEYGLEYEQSYIRAFKREFGLPPGELRKTGKILKITPPLQLFDSNKLADGLVFGPDIVHVPQFYVVGRRHKAAFRDALVITPRLAKQFFDSERMNIPNMINPNVHINICKEAGGDVDYSLFMPAIQVNSLDNVPEGYDFDAFPASLCANFRFICSNYADVNMAVADGMFNAIDDFMDNEHQRYFLERKRINFEIFDSSVRDGFFNQWEWFAPVVEKTKNHIQLNPDGIIKTYRQEVPALRFIGKKFMEPANDTVFDRILKKLDNCRLEYMFDTIEKKSKKDPRTLYEGGDAYVSLIRKGSGFVEYWLGLFMPKGTEVPKGYEMIDFPKSTLGVCAVYDKRNAIIHYETECKKKLKKEGILGHENTAEQKWFFLRFNWRRFFEEDKFGKRILEYCFYSC